MTDLQKIEEQLRIFKITKRQQKILMMRLGLGGYKIYTLDEIGIEFKITRERIRQIVKRAITKIKESKNIDLLNFLKKT